MASTDFISTQRFLYPDAADAYALIEDLFSRKLYHQLTDALLQFARDPKNNQGDNLLQLYERFVSFFESRLNQLHLVQFVAAVAQQYYPTRPYVVEELDRAVALLAQQLSRRSKMGEDRLQDDAFIVARVETALLKVHRASALVAAGSGEDTAAAATAAATVQLDEVKRELADCKVLLDGLRDRPDPAVSASYHRAAAEYYKVRGPASAFYESALLYLGNTPLESLGAAERGALAVDVALSALVGDGVYNFGEVNAHPVLGALAGTPHAWLVDLLAAFQTGNIDAFNAVVGANREAFDAAPALASSAAAIKEKITLLAVMELASRKPAQGGRALTFDEVAAETRLPGEQVEWVLMRALSLGLLRGAIDEVARTVLVTYVRPRVLDLAQIAALRDKVAAWRDRASGMLAVMEEHTSEIFK